MDDPLFGLEIESVATILDNIVAEANRSLSIIQPWCKAKTDNPALMKVIKDIRKHGQVYYRAIDKSICTAQEGFDFSRDVIGLCDHLLDEKTDLDDLRVYITEMKQDAQKAREGSTQVLDAFRKVREGFTDVAKRIPKAVAVKAEGTMWKCLIRLPFFNSERKRDIELEEAMKELDLAAINLAMLSKGIDAITKWWVGMETKLRGIEQGANKLKPGRHKLKIKGMQDQWRTINEEYSEYMIKITRLQDYYTLQELEG